MNELIKFLRKGIGNARGKRKEDECEKVLGNDAAVDSFASFWDHHAEELQIFVAVTLSEWEAKSSFSKEELEIYRLGLTELPMFFAKCIAERNRKLKELKDRQLPANS